MYWTLFRRTSEWAGSKFKVFFYDRPPLPDEVNPAADSAIASYTRPQLVALVEAGKAALAAWPEDK